MCLVSPRLGDRHKKERELPCGVLRCICKMLRHHRTEFIACYDMNE